MYYICNVTACSESQAENHGVTVSETKYITSELFSCDFGACSSSLFSSVSVTLSSVCNATVGQLYPLQASSVITDVIWQENEHAEFIFHIWQLNDSEFHVGFMEYEKCVFQKHHLYWFSLGLEKIRT